MGLLRILALPVMGPLDGVRWIAAQVGSAVEAERNDPTRIEAALRALERRLEKGEISETEYDAAETLLLAELRALRARRQAGVA